MIGTPGGTTERPAVFFEGPAQFRRWLEANHESATELWMGLNKKHVEPLGIKWAEAVEEALCFGWIDSVAQRIDEDSRRQRWSPRRPNSNWSNVNVALVEKLVAEGRMTPAGLAAFERRRPDRVGVYTHEQGEIELPPEYAERLSADGRASAFMEEATASYRRLAIRWVLTAKREETREKRLTELVTNSAEGQMIPSQRYGTEPAWVKRAREKLANIDE